MSLYTKDGVYIWKELIEYEIQCSDILIWPKGRFPTDHVEIKGLLPDVE